MHRHGMGPKIGSMGSMGPVAHLEVLGIFRVRMSRLANGQARKQIGHAWGYTPKSATKEEWRSESGYTDMTWTYNPSWSVTFRVLRLRRVAPSVPA